MHMRVRNPFTRELWFELLVTALARFDELSVRSRQGLEILGFYRFARGHARVHRGARPLLPIRPLDPVAIVDTGSFESNQRAGSGDLCRVLFEILPVGV